jgi:hypothetical protein
MKTRDFCILHVFLESAILLSAPFLYELYIRLIV